MGLVNTAPPKAGTLQAYSQTRLDIIHSHSNVRSVFDARTAGMIKALTDRVGPLVVNSAFRSAEYNAAIYRARGQKPTNSNHSRGIAIDIELGHLDQATRRNILKTALQLGFTGVGFYAGKSFIHLDTGRTRSWGTAPQWAADIMGNYHGKPPTISSSPIDNPNGLSAKARDTVIRTLLGEAQGEGNEGMLAVAHVIKNRTADKRWPATADGVSLQPSQFSTWNAKNNGGNDLARNADPNSDVYKRAGQIVDDVFAGKTQDPTKGAVYYYSPAGMPGGQAPYWWNSAKSETGTSTQIGSHIFTGASRGDQKPDLDSAKIISPGRGRAPETTVEYVEVDKPQKDWTPADHAGYEQFGITPKTKEMRERKVATLPEYTPKGSSASSGNSATGAGANAAEAAATRQQAVAAAAAAQQQERAQAAVGMQALSAAYAQQLAQQQAALNEQIMMALAPRAQLTAPLPITPPV